MKEAIATGVGSEALELPDHSANLAVAALVALQIALTACQTAEAGLGEEEGP